MTVQAASGAWPNKQVAFFRPKHAPPLPRDSLNRQSAIAQFAFTRFSTLAEAVSFLNDQNEAFSGRPLDIATLSDEGYTQVSAEIERLTAS